jgi:Clp amino terminal domain, pathogenicity island component
MTPAPSLHDLIETVRRDAGSDDILEQLATARAMVADLSETGDAVLGHFVDRARGSGRSWTEISNVLGVTKQAVHKRFTKVSLTLDLGEGPTFERFTDRARRAFEAATEQARVFGHPYVGTEHLLLGLYSEPESIATKVLVSAGLSQADVESDVVTRIGRAGAGSGPDERRPFTPRAKSILTGALEQAIGLGHNYIGTEHMLLGLYREPQGLAAQVLERRGLDQDTARAKVIEALSGYVEQQ